MPKPWPQPRPDERTMTEHTKTDGLPGMDSMVLPAVMERIHFHFAVGKHLAPATRELLARALAKLEANGELKRLADKWNED